MFRKTVFWLHLTCGVSAGIVVLMMSVTGVVLTYERQVQVWEDSSYYSAAQSGQEMMSADELIAASRELQGFEPSTLLISSGPLAITFHCSGTVTSQVTRPFKFG
jgi:uncharacterized iron-regulated membrane protein